MILFLSFWLGLDFKESKLTTKYLLSLLARKSSWTSIFNHMNQTCEVGLNHSRDHLRSQLVFYIYNLLKDIRSISIGTKFTICLFESNFVYLIIKECDWRNYASTWHLNEPVSVVHLRVLLGFMN
jgi:hypothetical protein